MNFALFNVYSVGCVISNWRYPRGCWGQVFKFKLENFVSKQCDFMTREA